MKFCPQCGAQNKDEAKFCVDCGADIENIAAAQPKSDTIQQQQTPQSKDQKKTWVAPLLNFIGGLFLYAACGIGHAIYLRLYNRAAILGAAGFMVSAIFLIISIFNTSYAVTLLSTILGMGLTIYAAYDAYKCSQAINEGRELPALFGSLRPESLSRGKATAITVIALVIAIVAFAAFVSSAAIEETSSTGLADNIISNDISNGDDIITDADDSSKSNDDTSSSSKNDDEGVQIKISYPGKWSASVGDESHSTSYEGTGDDIIKIDEGKYDVIAAAVQKTDGSSDKLKVKIIRNGDTLDSESTTEDFGVVTVSATL